MRAAARGEAPLDPRAGRALLSDRAAGRRSTALSEREREVLAMVARGLPNKLIARELAISEKTVKAHLTSVYRTIGVTDRTQAALWAERHGLGGPRTEVRLRALRGSGTIDSCRMAVYGRLLRCCHRARRPRTARRGPRGRGRRMPRPT